MARLSSSSATTLRFCFMLMYSVDRLKELCRLIILAKSKYYAFFCMILSELLHQSKELV